MSDKRWLSDKVYNDVIGRKNNLLGTVSLDKDYFAILRPMEYHFAFENMTRYVSRLQNVYHYAVVMLLGAILLVNIVGL